MSTEGLIHNVGAATGSRSLLRRMNTLGLLTRIAESPSTSAQLVKSSGLSRTAVDSVLADLLDLGWVQTHDAPSGRLGRPAAVFAPAQGLGVQVSIDIGAHHLHAVLAGLNGPVLARASAKVRETATAAKRLAQAETLIEQLLSDSGRVRADVWILSVGSPGSIHRGVVRHYGGAGMPGWIGLDLQSWFEERFDTAVIVEGDVALGAEAELAYGMAQGVQDVVYVLCGVRTSGALIVNGRVHRGVHGAAGIVGELPQLRWADLESQWSRGSEEGARPRREDVFARARAGDETAMKDADEFADALATGAAALVLAIDPELLVIGGGSSPSADVFLPRFARTLGELCPSVPEIAASALGSESVALGGLSLGRKYLEATLTERVRSDEAFPAPARACELLRERTAVKPPEPAPTPPRAARGR